MNGQCTTETFYILSPAGDGVVQNLQPIARPGCDNFYLPVFAEEAITNDLYNDKHSVIWFFDELFTEAHIFLQKKTGGSYIDVAEITDNTYGTFYELGFFINKFGESAIGVQIDWQKILTEEDTGVYRFKVTAVKSIGTFEPEYSFEFRLLKYSAARADQTVRVEWYRNGVLGDRSIDQKLNDYGVLNWYNQIRLPFTIFGFDTNEQVSEYVKYPNGANDWIQDSAVRELTLQIDRLPAAIHTFVEVDIMLAGYQIITDYNTQAPTKNVNRRVVPTSGYKPEYQQGTDLAPCTVTFKPYYENLTHLRE